MAYAVFRVESDHLGKAKRILNDDMLSRQSSWIKEASSLGLEGNHYLVVIEGTDEAIVRAKDMFSSESAGELLKDDEAKTIYDRIKEEEDSAVAGMGAIFG